MSFALIVYLIGILDSLDKNLGFVFFISLFAAFVGVVAIISSHDQAHWSEQHRDAARVSAYKLGWRVTKISLWVMSFCLVLSSFLPSKETAYTMLAASGVESIVTDERVQQIGGKSLDVIEQWLDEMSPEKEGE